MKEFDEPDNWIDPDDTCDEQYDRHIDKLAHLGTNILNAVRHLPTCLAVETGDILMRTMNVNEHIVRELFCNEERRFQPTLPVVSKSECSEFWSNYDKKNKC